MEGIYYVAINKASVLILPGGPYFTTFYHNVYQCAVTILVRYVLKLVWTHINYHF